MLHGAGTSPPRRITAPITFTLPAADTRGHDRFGISLYIIVLARDRVVVTTASRKAFLFTQARRTIKSPYSWPFLKTIFLYFGGMQSGL